MTVTSYFFKSFNPYTRKWERHSKTFTSEEEATYRAYRINNNSGRAVQVFSATNRKSTLILDLPENTD